MARRGGPFHDGCVSSRSKRVVLKADDQLAVGQHALPRHLDGGHALGGGRKARAPGNDVQLTGVGDERVRAFCGLVGNRLCVHVATFLG